MPVQQYSVNQYPVQMLLSLIESEEIGIPEIQRPFVWDSTKVRDLIDSLYRGYPVGYIITWKNPDVRLKDGSISAGKKILIDGQQRITALMAALLGKTVLNKDYKKVRIKIAFHPLEERFEVLNPAILKDKKWIPDISEIFSQNFSMLNLVGDYCTQNEISNPDEIHKKLENLKGIIYNPIGLIELNSDLDIETVTEIFIRINSAGVVLSQADFAMSKIAVNEKFEGNVLRKAIDYFCRLAVAPEFYHTLIEVDKNFTNTIYFKKMEWLKNENDDLYDPNYTDVLRVTFTYKFKRGRLRDLVALLSGRNFETHEFEERIAEESFKKLKDGFLEFINENKFKKFLMILNSAGFVDSSLIRSQNSINFAYILYLTMLDKGYNQAIIESFIRKWFVISILTGRYSNAPESQFDLDIRRMEEEGIENYIQHVIKGEMSDAFWDFTLPQKLNTSVASSPAFNVFLAAQVKMKDKGFLSKDITVHDLVVMKGDVHHIFPKQYLKKHGLTRGMYNQVANYVMTQSEINIAIGAKEPKQYFAELLEQCNGGKLRYGAITSKSELMENLRMNCIPEDVFEMTVEKYPEFLEKRRVLMARKMKDYFFKL